MLVKHYRTVENGVHTIWIQNHTHKRPFLKSDDESVVDARWKEIKEDIKKTGSRVDVLVTLYRFAKNHGCITVWKQRVPSAGVLKIRPSGQDEFGNEQWALILAKGKEEVILKESIMMSELRDLYIQHLKEKAKDPMHLHKMWEYQEAQQKLDHAEA